MFTLYSFLLTLGFIIFLPRFIYDWLRHGKYSAGFWQRMGRLPDFDSGGKPVIWLHCVSVGETQAARPLVEAILKNYPNYALVVSTTTKTGQALAHSLFHNKAAFIFYFPFDWKFAVRRALRHIKPSIMLLMETELWFNFLRETHKSGAKIIIVNGRLSERSANRLMKFPKFMRRVSRYIEMALMQSRSDVKRITDVGIRGGKVKLTGNIKFDQELPAAESPITAEFRKRFGFAADSPLIVCASTHEPEETWLLEAFKMLYKSGESGLPRLMLVPRHPERFVPVAKLVADTGFSYALRSAAPKPDDELADVILLDSIGELRDAYPIAELVFVGGSLIPHGGQNVLEPAAARKAIVTGHHTSNFTAIIAALLEKDAVVRLPELTQNEIPQKLFEAFRELLRDDERRRALAQNAFAVTEKNRGATARTLEYLDPILKVHDTFVSGEA
jgi:3-deoxy-D-manno-octulosonic-acid transferase